MQYMAFYYAENCYVPVILTDGNIIILCIHHPRRNTNQRLYWAFGQILYASMHVEELAKQIACANPLLCAYVTSQDDHSDSDDGPATNPESLSANHLTDGQDDADADAMMTGLLYARQNSMSMMVPHAPLHMPINPASYKALDKLQPDLRTLSPCMPVLCSVSMDPICIAVKCLVHSRKKLCVLPDSSLVSLLCMVYPSRQCSISILTLFQDTIL